MQTGKKEELDSPSSESSLLNKEKMNKRVDFSLNDTVRFHFGFRSEETYSIEDWDSVEIVSDKQEIMSENLTILGI